MVDISIIIPCYNVEKYIDRCMDSVIGQSFGLNRMEVILINDCSTDGTMNKLLEWERRFPENIVVSEFEVNRRLGTGRNYGLSLASAEWVAFIDSDDWIERDYFEKLYEAAVSEDVDVVCCKSDRDKGDNGLYFPIETRSTGKENKKYVINTISERKDFFRLQPLKLYAWGKLIKKKLLTDNNILFPEYLAYEDIIWGNLIHMYAKKAYCIEEKLYHYYVNPSSLVLKKNEQYHIDHFTVQEKMWDDWVSRGLLSEYRNELEYEYFYNGFLAFLKILVYRYDTPQFSLFQLLQTATITKLSYDTNPYFNEGKLPEFHKLLLDSSRTKISLDEYVELAELVRKIGL